MAKNRLLNFTCTMSSILPRGKGAFARKIGKLARYSTQPPFVTRHGASIPILPQAYDVFVTMRSQNNAWDYWVFRVANAMLEADGVLYDAGANIGYVSIEVAALRADAGIQVYAFEPQSQLAENITKAVKLNNLSNLQVFPIALGDSTGTLEFSEKPHSIHGAIANRTCPGTTVVPAYRLDEVVAEYKMRPPDVIKIDVEGFEHAVLTGATKLISRFQPTIVFELSDGTRDFGYSLQMYATLFDSVGDYQFFTVKGTRLNLAEVEIARGEHIDVVAVPARRRERFDWFVARLADGKIDGLWA